MIEQLGAALLATIRDVLAVSVLLVGFQLLVLRQPIPHLRRLLLGLAFVVLGLALFMMGLQLALIPLGELMAAQLSSTATTLGGEPASRAAGWWSYGWVYLFAAAVGFSATLAEPSLMAIAYKARSASRGTIRPWGLRLVVALGVGVGISLGTLRIVSGLSLVTFLAVGYLVVLVQTIFAPRAIIPLAYDSGGVTTSSVTVPVVTALGLGLAAAVPGRDPALDGFGLIAFASLFPMITVMGYAQLAEWRARPRTGHSREG